MIPNDIEFVQPTTLRGAAAAWTQASEAGRRVCYFGGGTELVTGAREKAGEFDVAIDLKRIPELLEFDPPARRFGAGVRLSALSDRSPVPLLALAAGRVADRTVRNSITLGGNLCSRLPYRETMLPLLLFDAELTLCGPVGARTARAGDVCAKRLRLGRGEFIVAVSLPAIAEQPGFYLRRTRDARVDYPLVTLCMARVDGDLRFAVGGAFGYPVRSSEAEAVLNGDRDTRGGDLPGRARAESVVDAIPHRLWGDMRASADYRRELLVLAVMDGIAHLEDL